jgi:hypothetical protein
VFFQSGFKLPTNLISDVKNNSLTGAIPDTIGNCTSFQVLYVHAFFATPEIIDLTFHIYHFS